MKTIKKETKTTLTIKNAYIDETSILVDEDGLEYDDLFDVLRDTFGSDSFTLTAAASTKKDLTD